jgi:hypothetical protein
MERKFEWMLVLRHLYDIEIKDLVDPDWSCPFLWMACLYGYADVVTFLLNYGSDPNMTWNGNRLLCKLATVHTRQSDVHGHPDRAISEEEVESGWMRDENGVIRISKLHIIEILLDAGASCKGWTAYGLTETFIEPRFKSFAWTYFDANSFRILPDTRRVVRRMVEEDHDFRPFFMSCDGRRWFTAIMADDLTDFQVTKYEDCRSYLLPRMNRDKFYVFLRGHAKEPTQLNEDLITILYELVLTKRSRAL